MRRHVDEINASMRAQVPYERNLSTSSDRELRRELKAMRRSNKSCKKTIAEHSIMPSRQEKMFKTLSKSLDWLEDPLQDAQGDDDDDRDDDGVSATDDDDGVGATDDGGDGSDSDESMEDSEFVSTLRRKASSLISSQLCLCLLSSLSLFLPSTFSLFFTTISYYVF
ncbi:hypothetical protein CRG98_042194 [Punica granatum]|uniref:Uncharacterized protein n=1 Tax=Punica granatum TaxID=22663 RepID=A0A2I0I0C9_PUNGR|nr:hypothetical protein CRG98_042194 [Punica granatum]